MEQAVYAAAQASAGEVATVVPIQDVQLDATTSAMDIGAMEVDQDVAIRGPVDESYGGLKRKADDDAESTTKKLRMGIVVTLFATPAADSAITYRTCRCSFEEVNLASLPLIVQLLTGDHRDRENCTVFVSDLQESTTEDDLKALFKDVRFIPTLFRIVIDASFSQCGDIREVRMTKLRNFQVATVEFSERVR